MADLQADDAGHDEQKREGSKQGGRIVRDGHAERTRPRRPDAGPHGVGRADGISCWAIQRKSPLKAIETAATPMKKSVNRVVCDSLNPSGQPISNRPATIRYVHAKGIQLLDSLFIFCDLAMGRSGSRQEEQGNPHPQYSMHGDSPAAQRSG
jgi:hypothetical protein